MKKYVILLLVLGLFLAGNRDRIVATTKIDEEIAAIEKQISEIDKAITPLKQESDSLRVKITDAKSQMAITEKKIVDIGNKLIDSESDLEVQKVLLGERIRRFYINSKKYSPLMILVTSSDEAADMVKQFSFYQAVINQDKMIIGNFQTQIEQLNTNKKSMESVKVKLADLKKKMEDRSGFLATEIKKAEDYKSELSKKQKDLLAEKTAMFNTSVGEVSTSTDPASRADYNPGFSPAFAAFSFGAPHRKGMSQYGAFGRAKAGKGYEEILKTYYGDIRIEKIEIAALIKTDQGSLPFEDNYLVGIAEMPAGWGDQGGYEALKAQAIAARTYALNSTGNLSGTICTTESCQVYSKSRLNSPGKWKQAVEDTRGMVIKSNATGQIFSTMYASTSGGATLSYASNGHTTPMVWDTTCGNQTCWPGDAFEKSAGSPWYYKGWYKTRSNNAYGRSHPWLNNEEFTDVLNAILYFSKTKDSSHLSQTQNCINSCDSNAWAKDELKRQVADKGGPISSVNSINVDFSTSGTTQTVRVSTDKGDFSFNGSEFKEIFVLRAPGAIATKSDLFNIEKK